MAIPRNVDMIDFLLFLTFCLFSLGQAGRISLFAQQINGYAYEIAFVPLAAALVWRYRQIPLKWAWKHAKPYLILPAYLAVAYLFDAVRYTPFENLSGALYLVRLAGYLLIGVYLAYHGMHNRRTMITRAIAAVYGITVVMSFLQYFFYSNLIGLYFEGWDPHVFRMVGLFLDPPVAAAVYGILFAYIFRVRMDLWKRIVVSLPLAAAFMLTYSRGAYLAALVCLAIYIVQKRQWIGGAVIAAVFVASLVILPQQISEGANLVRINSIFSRVADDAEGLAVWQQHPVWGIGYNRIRSVKRYGEQLSPNSTTYSHAGAAFHSSFLTIAATGGFIGLGLFLWLLWVIAQRGEYALYAVVFLSVLSLSDNILLHPFLLFLLLSTTSINNPSGTSR